MAYGFGVLLQTRTMASLIGMVIARNRLRRRIDGKMRTLFHLGLKRLHKEETDLLSSSLRRMQEVLRARAREKEKKKERGSKSVVHNEVKFSFTTLPYFHVVTTVP